MQYTHTALPNRYAVGRFYYSGWWTASLGEDFVSNDYKFVFHSQTQREWSLQIEFMQQRNEEKKNTQICCEAFLWANKQNEMHKTDWIWHFKNVCEWCERESKVNGGKKVYVHTNHRNQRAAWWASTFFNPFFVAPLSQQSNFNSPLDVVYMVSSIVELIHALQFNHIHLYVADLHTIRCTNTNRLK